MHAANVTFANISDASVTPLRGASKEIYEVPTQCHRRLSCSSQRLVDLVGMGELAEYAT